MTTTTCNTKNEIKGYTVNLTGIIVGWLHLNQLTNFNTISNSKTSGDNHRYHNKKTKDIHLTGITSF